MSSTKESKTLVEGGLTLHLVDIRIPSHAVRNQSARLECHFELDGETLYSVKWYKDGNEFYRFVPRDMPPTQTFPLPGVTVDVSSCLLLHYMCCWSEKKDSLGVGLRAGMGVENIVSVRQSEEVDCNGCPT
ncbi:hypothetical protein JTB14_019107 [Gonioctena quinquepunctata]|nr:hypothetical protein JTB14_019107 [Gonioctena quinquepunctata]